MSVKRRDNKNRILRNGESQRADGRYAYVYVDANGKQRFVYSWKLEKTDKLPKGKRDCISLREKIQEIKKDLDDGIVPGGGDMTVLELVEKYEAQKKGVRPATKSIYQYVIWILKSEKFGEKRIDKVKLSDAKEWLIRLQSDGKSYNTIYTIRRVIKPAFQMAVNDDIIRKNPFEFALTAVITNDSVPRKAVTDEQEKSFLEFIKNDSRFCKYYDAIYILFNTGLRISELAGLTLSDIDFTNCRIKVDHQLLSREDEDPKKLYIEKTKTESGVRYVPMTEKVAECLKRIIERREGAECVIDGVSGFIFTNEQGIPKERRSWDKCFASICKKYNRTHENHLKVTPHVCRHTFCSRMARSGMNPKSLQYIMGHSAISITLDTYTHVRYEDAQREMERVYQTDSGEQP